MQSTESEECGIKRGVWEKIIDQSLENFRVR